MKALLGFLVFTALTAIVPLYGNFIYDRYKAHEWRKAALHSTVALLFVLVIFVLGYFGWSAQTARDARHTPKLEYLNAQSFSDEVTLRRQQNLLSGQSLDQHLQIVKTKFEEAEYAQEKNDFDRAIQLYAEIQRGSDRNGEFVKFPSACIENNMAVDLFRKQGDRQFKASSLLLDALKMSPKPQDQMDLIQRNIDALDQYVNQ
jgi:hypothetical protein